MPKIRVGIIFGGRSGEHEVSLQSAKNVLDALDKRKYQPVLIGIDKGGRWLSGGAARTLLRTGGGPGSSLSASAQCSLVPHIQESAGRLDVVFPVLHGPYGEDGTIQGFLKLAGVPFVGASVLGSAVGMDKDVMKRLLREAGIPTPRFLTFHRPAEVKFEVVRRELSLPLFIKPANLGSSIGVSKAGDKREFQRAIKEAFKYDSKIIVEEFVSGREIECAVLGNERPIASVPGEIIPDARHGFYSYEAKYLDENGALLEIPARLPSAVVERVQSLAVRTFRVLGCEGMGRVDFFLKKNGEVLVNEINTIPGFTKISMYPKLWAASGIPYPELIDRLIKLALERHVREKKLKVSL